MASRFVILGSALLVGGCSGEDSAAASSGAPAGCAPGEWLRDDGVCVPAGLPPDMPCPPGEWLRETDGACIPAGVPPDGCGEGFAHDGDRGCEPILPAEPCPDGLMAVPGDTRCREVAPCAAGTFGDIPVEPDTEYVDASYTGASDGSLAAPWTTIQAAIDAALPGAMVAVAAGSYLEDIVLQGKSVRLWGKCPALVELEGSATGFAAFDIGVGASGTEVRRLGITGQARGVFLSGSEDVLIAETWIHDTSLRGIVVQNDFGSTSLTLRRALVERAHTVGVFLVASEVTVEAILVRDTSLDEQGFFGRGISMQDHAGMRGSLIVFGSLFERNHSDGVFVAGSDATVETTAVRDTIPDAHALLGRGISAQDNPASGARASLHVLRSILERNYDTGMFVAGADATVDAVVVRDNIPDAQGSYGRGIAAQNDPETGARANLTVARSLVERNYEAGVVVWGSDGTVEATVTRDNLLNARGRFGQGIIALHDAETRAPASVAVLFSLVERNREMGMSVVGADATVDATVVRDTLHSVPELGSAGIYAHDDVITGTRARLSVARSLIERNEAHGVAVDGADATIETTVMRDTLADQNGFGRPLQVQSSFETGAASSAVIRGSVFERSVRSAIGVIGSASAEIDACVVRDTAAVDGYLGDGLVVWSLDGPASATVTATRIEESARAAVSSFGATVALKSSRLVCQSFDIGAEIWQGQPAVFDDRGDVLCGCPEATEGCKAQSYALEPPPSD